MRIVKCNSNEMKLPTITAFIFICIIGKRQRLVLAISFHIRYGLIVTMDYFYKAPVKYFGNDILLAALNCATMLIIIDLVRDLIGRKAGPACGALYR